MKQIRPRQRVRRKKIGVPAETIIFYHNDIVQEG